MAQATTTQTLEALTRRAKLVDLGVLSMSRAEEAKLRVALGRARRAA